MRVLFILPLVWALAGCGAGTVPVHTARPADPPRLSPEQAVENFVTAASRMEPVAERTCRQRAPQYNCDFLIRVDPDPRAPVNAFQTQLEDGQPLIVFTLAMIAEVRNIDELAFVMGHEAAHHIEGHIPETLDEARRGAILLGTLAGLATVGASEEVQQNAVESAARAGAMLGARRFSKVHELEADALGTRLTVEAGFDAARGALFFARIPDPGDAFLGTHPPNAQRVAVVEQTLAEL